VIVRDVLGIHGNPDARHERGEGWESANEGRLQVGDRAVLGQVEGDQRPAGTLSGQGEQANLNRHGGAPGAGMRVSPIMLDPRADVHRAY
jgi:hypothetical protein